VHILKLDFGILSLISQVPRVDSIKQFRPIADINMLFKLISKVYEARLPLVANKTISLSQTTFIEGQFILDGAMVLPTFSRQIGV
jgi:hypothetical protein